MKTALILISILLSVPLTAQDFKSSLTFYSSFDGDTKADLAKGDGNIYTATSRKELNKGTKGMTNPDHEIIKGEGKYGDAFRFGKKSSTVIYYKSKDNIVYDPKNWSGTISFWLRVDPTTELAPGYTDPIQITDVNYNDAAIWVDFTNKNPRNFRLGVIGDLDYWNPEKKSPTNNPDYEKRLVTVQQPPFKKTAWTHITITYSGLGSGNGTSTLFIDGKVIGTISDIKDPFNWELEKSNIFLGLNFIGMMDEFAVFDRPFEAKDVKALYELEGGLKSIL